MQARIHRADVDSKNVCDLIERELFVLEEHQSFPLCQRKGSYSLTDKFGSLLLEKQPRSYRFRGKQWIFAHIIKFDIALVQPVMLACEVPHCPVKIGAERALCGVKMTGTV